MALCKLWATEIERELSLLSEAIHHGITVFRHHRLKPAQLDAVQAIIQGQDVFVNVPTGYGKSLVYQVLPFCTSFFLEKSRIAAKAMPTVLVVSPLLALMQDQACKLRHVPEAKSLLLSEDSNLDDSAVFGGGWTHILASPETLLESPRWRKLLAAEFCIGG